MTRHRTLFMTERSRFHQQFALDAAPPALDVVMLRQPEPAELTAQLAEAEFMISERAGVIDAAMIAAAPHLRMIVRVGSLAHDIDLDAARGQGVIVSLWPQPGVIFVAEHIILQMQALAKRLRKAEAKALGAGSDAWAASRRTDEDTFAYNWTQMLDVGGLFEKTIGILGFGEIGAEVARHLQGWGCRMLYNRRRRLPEALEAELGITYAAQDEVLAESDFVANLLPYYPETDMSLGAPAFAGMKRGACLVSCGSGSVIDEAALAEAVRSGHLAGAALDTFEWEPVKPDNPLRLMAVADPQVNVLLTPHTANGTPSRDAVPTNGRARDYEPLLRFLAGQPIPNRLA